MVEGASKLLETRALDSLPSGCGADRWAMCKPLLPCLKSFDYHRLPMGTIYGYRTIGPLVPSIYVNHHMGIHRSAQTTHHHLYSTSKPKNHDTSRRAYPSSPLGTGRKGPWGNFETLSATKAMTRFNSTRNPRDGTVLA